MSIHHHPSLDLLASFAVGRLDQAQQLVVATHVARCAYCRTFVSALEAAAGNGLEAALPAAITTSFDAVLERIETPDRRSSPPASAAAKARADVLPHFLGRYELGRWKWIAPGVSLRPILLSTDNDSRAFLLKSGPGTRMLNHTHTGVELTCVLSGRFVHAAGEFGPGDFDYGDDLIDHQPVVADEGDCVCIVAMTGQLRLNGLLGRIMQPFIRL